MSETARTVLVLAGWIDAPVNHGFTLDLPREIVDVDFGDLS
jgi:hypothetical protein